MARIYLEYTKNIIFEHPDYFMFAFFIAVALTLVSIHDVLINIPKDSFPHAFNFFVYALRNTSWIMQTLIAGFFIRVIVSGAILAYKSVGPKWSAARLRY